jgi:hypothetical protein
VIHLFLAVACLAQDQRVEQAVRLLPAHERPAVPIRVTRDVTATYAGYGITRIVRRDFAPDAFLAPDRTAVWVNRKGAAYRDIERLAATLAHEAHHLAHDGPDKNANEVAARMKEIEVLERLGERTFAKALRSLFAIEGRTR